MADEQKTTAQKAVMGYLSTGGKTIALTLAGRNVRLGLMTISLLVAGWLLYIDVYKPISDPVSLPIGVTPNNPELDSQSLQTINNERVSRGQYLPKSFQSYNQFFLSVLPTTTPTP